MEDSGTNCVRMFILVLQSTLGQTEELAAALRRPASYEVGPRIWCWARDARIWWEKPGKHNHSSRMLCAASKEWAKRKESCDQKPREGRADMKYDPGRSIWNWFRSREWVFNHLLYLIAFCGHVSDNTHLWFHSSAGQKSRQLSLVLCSGPMRIQILVR